MALVPFRALLRIPPVVGIRHFYAAIRQKLTVVVIHIQPPTINNDIAPARLSLTDARQRVQQLRLRKPVRQSGERFLRPF